MCVGEIEHLRHLFFECSFAKECWLKLGINVDSWDIEISHEWLLQKLATGSKEETLKIVTVLWGVWFTRNKRIFENKVMTPDFVMAWSRRQIVEWQEANRKVQDIDTRIAENREAENIWQTPTKGCLKINVDASFVEGQDYYLIGMDFLRSGEIGFALTAPPTISGDQVLAIGGNGVFDDGGANGSQQGL
ncbi:uncharacterized protein LOC141719937 [Apium graveolens]|uniref:uncharacterized protein LOC141719937 n=1 Tax=Apium graveolens TaxID=4045 RepID=UPI003D7B585D